MTKANEPAFPMVDKYSRPAVNLDSHVAREQFGAGLTKREYAAIKLRVPSSGDDEIDAMIKIAERRDIAAMAMQGDISEGHIPLPYERSEHWVRCADALIAELAKVKPEDVAEPKSEVDEFGNTGWMIP